MKYTAQLVRSCCNNGKTICYILDKPLEKTNLENFQVAGYICPQHFEELNIFYVALVPGFFATTAYGNTFINVKCSEGDCDRLAEAFEEILGKL